LVFIHWNIPHFPAIYDARKDDFSNDPANSYTGNLRLVDRTVRDIRLTLEKTGMWDSSTILMTSDHPLRLTGSDATPPSVLGPALANNYTQASEVPFLLKMAGQKQGFAYHAAMQTVVTKDLLLSIMRGEITQPEQVAAWLDHNPPHR
jgi:phosphoglycerol transferase MdoB-like AlkP superfamily enzyme